MTLKKATSALFYHTFFILMPHFPARLCQH
jgi:hypothetical protein